MKRKNFLTKEGFWGKVNFFVNLQSGKLRPLAGKICFGFLLALIFVFAGINMSKAQADGINLGISKSIIIQKLNSPSESDVSLILENKSNNSIRTDIVFKPFAPSGEEGQVQLVGSDNIIESYKRIFSKVFVTENGIAKTRIDIGPKQKTNLKLHFSIPENEPASDYYFSVIFIGKPAEIDIQSMPKTDNDQADQGPDQGGQNLIEDNYSIVNAGLGVNVILSIGDSLKQAYIEEFSTPSLIQGGPVKFRVRLKNSGTQMINPSGAVSIKNMFGQTVGRLEIDPTNILSMSTRVMTNQKSFDLKSPGSGNNVLWGEKFLMGPYTATLDISLGEKQPTYSRTINFVAVPVPLIAAIVIIFPIIIFIIFRVRYYLKTEK